MKRYTRMILIGAGALVVVLIAAVALAIAVINPNDYKPQIEALALKATGKPLSLQGDLSLSVFPGISIDMGAAELRDEASFGPEPFLRLEKASASVAFFPLLSGKVQIGDVTISGVRLKLAVDKHGKANWEFPAAAKAETEPEQAPAQNAAQSSGGGEFDLSSIALSSLQLRNALVTYADLRGAERMELSVPKFTLDNVQVDKKTSLALEAGYSGALQKPVALTMNASFTFPSSLETGTTLTMHGKLDGTEFSGTCLLALPSSPGGTGIQAKGEFKAGSIDLDAYTASSGGKKSARQEQGAEQRPKQAGASSGDEDMRRLLHKLFLDLRLTVQSITVAKIPVKDIEVTVKADGGLVTVKPASMTVAGAPLTFEASVDARNSDIRSRVTGNWKNAKIAPLVKAVSGRELLSGTLNANWNMATTGLAQPNLTKNLNGKAAFELLDGTLFGFPVIPSGIPGLPAMTENITIVKSAASWNVVNGIAQNDDLAVNAATLSATGSGQIDIPAQTIAYKLAVTLPPIKEAPHLKTLPVIVSGPLSAPEYRVDEVALMRGTAKSLLDPETKTGKKVQEGLGKALDGLFKRK